MSLYQRTSKAGIKGCIKAGLIFLPRKFFKIGFLQGVREPGLRRGPYGTHRTIFRKTAFFFVCEADIDAYFPFYRFEHLDEGYVPRLFSKRKTALYAPVGAYDLGFDQLLKYLGQKAPRDFVFFRYFSDKADLFERLAGQIQDTAYPVVSLSSDLHGIYYSKPVVLVKLNNIIVHCRAFPDACIRSTFFVIQ